MNPRKNLTLNRALKYPGTHAASRLILYNLILLLIVMTPSLAVDHYTETCTGKAYPTKIEFSYNGMNHSLVITGLAARKKYVFNVYSIAHYMENPPSGNGREILSAILADGSIKQITMNFVRNVKTDKIQAAFTNGLRTNATDAELNEIRPFIRQFANAIKKDVKKDDNFIIRWLPDGTTLAFYQGKEVSAIKNPTFARILWSIWFGEHSVVDRNALIQLVVASS